MAPHHSVVLAILLSFFYAYEDILEVLEWVAHGLGDVLLWVVAIHVLEIKIIVTLNGFELWPLCCFLTLRRCSYLMIWNMYQNEFWYSKRMDNCASLWTINKGVKGWRRWLT